MKKKKDTELEEATRHANAGQEAILNNRAVRRPRKMVKMSALLETLTKD